MKRHAVITDIDNTLYNFVDTFAPAFRAMVHALAWKLNVSEKELVEEYKNVYSIYGSLEYKYSTDKLEVLQKLRLSDAERRSVAQFARQAFGRSANKRLVPYAGVRETLGWLRRQGYYLVAYTDGPLSQAAWRLHQLGVITFFDAIVAWIPEASELDGPPPSYFSKEDRWYLNLAEPTPGLQRIDAKLISVPREHLKPNPAFLSQLLHDAVINASESWLVGDSISKDIAPAQSVGLRDVWARYGQKYQKKNWDTLVSVSPWEASSVEREATQPQDVRPTVIIDSFAELQKVIPIRQLELFDL